MTDQDLSRIAISHGLCLAALTPQELALLRAVAEAQREEDERACEKIRQSQDRYTTDYGQGMHDGADMCAAAIRSRSPSADGREG